MYRYTDPITHLMTTLLTSRYMPRPAPTPEQLAAAEKREERLNWNVDVEQRRAEKKAKKVKKTKKGNRP